MFTPKELKGEIIDPVLFLLSPVCGSQAQAAELLLGTSAVESGLGKYRTQIGGGPALGIWQMEPATERDIWKNYLAYNIKFRKLIRQLQQDRTPQEMVWNDFYACAMARAHYRRAKEPLPQCGDLEGQARYWKQYYNTPLGAGTPEKYIVAWKKLVEGRIK